MTWQNRMRPSLSLLGLVAIVSSLAVGCRSGSVSSGEHALAMVPLDEMPDEVQQAMVPVRQAYQYAAGNPEVFEQVPCYCGCATQGHTSNYECYVASADGEIQYDTHALACGVCVDITHDTVRLLKEGKALPEIRAYIATTYSRYGLSTGP